MTRMVITFSAALVIIHMASSVQVIGQKKKKKKSIWSHEHMSKYPTLGFEKVLCQVSKWECQPSAFSKYYRPAWVIWYSKCTYCAKRKSITVLCYSEHSKCVFLSETECDVLQLMITRWQKLTVKPDVIYVRCTDNTAVYQ